MAITRNLSVASFKEEIGAKELLIVRNPNTNKLFMSADGKTVGSVGKEVDLKGRLQVIQLVDDQTAETLWCLCNEKSENVVLTL